MVGNRIMKHLENKDLGDLSCVGRSGWYTMAVKQWEIMKCNAIFHFQLYRLKKQDGKFILFRNGGLSTPHSKPRSRAGMRVMESQFLI
jgi:hypothetical protein